MDQFNVDDFIDDEISEDNVTSETYEKKTIKKGEVEVIVEKYKKESRTTRTGYSRERNKLNYKVLCKCGKKVLRQSIRNHYKSKGHMTSGAADNFDLILEEMVEYDNKLEQLRLKYGK